MARKTGYALVLALALAGCVSLGPKIPPQLLTLTAQRVAEAGSGLQGQARTAIAVQEPAAAQKLQVTRVPVQIDAATLAYLKDASWVERPTRLFQRLLGETLRAEGKRLVMSGTDLEYTAATQLAGELVEMGYDAASSSVVVRYDAVLQLPGGEVRTRRFEAIESGVAHTAAAVGPALNRAANTVASEVAGWVG